MARSFNGSSDVIDVGTAISVGGIHDWSAAAWINYAGGIAASGFGGIISKRDTFTNIDMEYELYVFNNAGTLEAGLANGTLFTSAGSISTSVWSHIAVTGATANGIKYVAGSAVQTTSADYRSGSDATARVVIGASYQSVIQDFFPGSIAEAAVWDAKLDAAEIAALAEGYSPVFIRPGNLIGYWPLVRTLIDTIGAQTGTATGTTVIAHPRIIMPVNKQLKSKFVFVEPPSLRAQIWM